ncbi:hypothetical protein [Streptomyces sp. NPDC007346]|uniref:hypothetical protein n=1 Tax=Streptomyces sp. NPDC007346 TaxID=3154682 RepID=UPI0034562FD8
MPTEDLPGLTAQHWEGCTDMYDFLDRIRLRPDMWVSSGSLLPLPSLLTGYRAALGVHGIGDPFAFWPEDDFNRWLQEQRGITSSLTWAAEIERNTPEGLTPVEEFFRLLDAYRSESAQNSASGAASIRFPGIEYMNNTFVALFRRRRRRAAVLQRRFLCLLHSNDPDIRFEPVGAMPVLWNEAEALDVRRC